MKRSKKDFEKVEERSHEIARTIAALMTKPGLDMKDSIIAIMLGVCRLLQALSLAMGKSPKELGDLFREGVKIFFEEGGDISLNDLFKNDINVN